MCTQSTIVLVGTKRDLRDTASDRLEESLKDSYQDRDTGMASRLRAEANFRAEFVSRDRGERMAKSVGAAGFTECSSLYRDCTREVFEITTKTALRKTRRKRTADNRRLDSMCAIL